MVAIAAVLACANQSDAEVTGRRAALDPGDGPSVLLLTCVIAATESLLMFLMLTLNLWIYRLTEVWLLN